MHTVKHWILLQRQMLDGKAAGGAEKEASISAYRDHVHLIGRRICWENKFLLLPYMHA